MGDIQFYLDQESSAAYATAERFESMSIGQLEESVAFMWAHAEHLKSYGFTHMANEVISRLRKAEPILLRKKELAALELSVVEPGVKSRKRGL